METNHMLLTVQEACSIARVSEAHIRGLCAKGKIRAVKVGQVWRINRADFMRFMALDDSEVVADGASE